MGTMTNEYRVGGADATGKTFDIYEKPKTSIGNFKVDVENHWKVFDQGKLAQHYNNTKTTKPSGKKTPWSAVKQGRLDYIDAPPTNKRKANKFNKGGGAPIPVVGAEDHKNNKPSLKKPNMTKAQAKKVGIPKGKR